MILIGLGANLPSRYGPPEDTLAAACVSLDARGVHVVQASSIWLSAPVPASDQPWYHNAVVAVETDLAVHDLLCLLKQIEGDFGRVQDMPRNAPRVLDLDILAYHDVVYENDAVMVPHPRLHERAFVLYPLQEVQCAFIHPKVGLSVAEMIAHLPAGQAIKKLHNVAA